MDSGAVNGWRLEWREPSNHHHKFYKILYKDNKVIFNWGRIGSPGQIAYRELHSSESFESEPEVMAQAQMELKLKEGYKRVSYHGSRKEDWEILFTRAALKAGVYQKPE